MRLEPSRYRAPVPGAPRNPRRANWIWLASSLLTVAVLAVAAVRLSGGGCPAPGGGAATDSSGAASRDAAAAAPAGGPAGPSPGVAVLRAGGRLARARPGRAVFYDPGRAAGSCSLGPFPAGGWYASLPPGGYAGGTACGSYLDVRGPRGWVRAEVVDLCPACAAGTVDLSRAAFARIASPRAGTAQVTVQPAADPPLPGPLVLRLITAARPGTLAVQVRNHGNRLASVEVSLAPGGRWARLSPDPDGYWAGPLRPAQPRPPARISLRVTDAAGHQVLIRGVALAATLVRSTRWMYPRQAGLARGRAGRPRTTVARASPGCPR